MSLASQNHAPRRGFSLIELVIVVVIIGIIGAIAVPRMSRGAKGASDSALAGDLRVLRDAFELFAVEHGGSYPDGADLPDALTRYTSARFDDLSNTRTTTHIYGPYIRAVPKLPVGSNKGRSTFASSAPGVSASNDAWYYNPSTGEVRANCPDSETDDAGVEYNKY